MDALIAKNLIVFLEQVHAFFALNFLISLSMFSVLGKWVQKEKFKQNQRCLSLKIELE